MVGQVMWLYHSKNRQKNVFLLNPVFKYLVFRCCLFIRYFLLWVRPASIEDNPNDESSTTDIPRVYLKALSMIEYDPFLVTHATATKVDVQVTKK